jgi:hypothetical protein
MELATASLGQVKSLVGYFDIIKNIFNWFSLQLFVEVQAKNIIILMREGELAVTEKSI